MVVDLHALKKDIEAYPDKLRIALARERELEDQVEALQAEIDVLTGPAAPPVPGRRLSNASYASLHNDSELIKLRRELDRLRQKKIADVVKNPSAYDLPARATQKMIDAVVTLEPEIEARQRKIEEREDLLRQQAEQSLVSASAQEEMMVDPTLEKEISKKQKELEKAQKALREATIEREVVEQALPRMYELLVQLGQAQ